VLELQVSSASPNFFSTSAIMATGTVDGSPQPNPAGAGTQKSYDAIAEAEKLDEKDELAALEALEKEASEFNKVSAPPLCQPSLARIHQHLQDAEIDRILKAFRLDA
jgi:hypothetical protein